MQNISLQANETFFVSFFPESQTAPVVGFPAKSNMFTNRHYSTVNQQADAWTKDNP